MRTAANAVTPLVSRSESAFGVLYTNDNQAELMIVVTVVICRLTQKYAQMQHPLFGNVGCLLRIGDA